MAPPVGTLRVGRYFTALLLLLAVLYAVVAFGPRSTPKLGIDLVGGKRIIFTAITGNGTTPTASSMSQARQIIEDRINQNGVTGSTVQVQGTDELVVLIPGGTAADVALLGQPAVLNFRPLIASAVPVTCVSRTAASGSATATPSTPSSGSATGSSSAPAANSSGSASGTASASAAPNDAGHRVLAAAPSKTAKKPTTPASRSATRAASSPTPTSSGAGASSSAAAAPQRCVKAPFDALTKADPKLTIPTTAAQYNALTATQKSSVQAAMASYDCTSAVYEKDKPTRYYLACDDGTSYGEPVAYLLGQVIVKGSQVDNASAQAPSTSGTGGPSEWTVALNLKSSGATAWAKWTAANNTNDVTTGNALQCGPSQTFPCTDWVGFTLNGRVISAPYTSGTINGTTQISGNFVQKSADDLAQQLNYGSLPLSFRTQADEDVSATLGTQQLRAAFLAGGIGLVLVVIYSMLYYRGLGLVTIASLIVSAGLTYAMLVLLGSQIGFTLDLAGIAGFIVALGITADSFVVFFERIKDEVHEGRSMRVAVPRAWVRARRTILSADTVSFLAAAILYFFASADVKGFAFTLGMSTILDLVVVFLFTHPVVSLLSRSATFGSPRFTGLNSVRTGAVLDDEFSVGTRRPPRRARTAVSTSKDAGGRSQTALVDEDGAQILDTGPVHPEHGQTDPGDPEDVGTGSTAIGGAGGTAAERAAARRARLRAKRDEEGTS